MDNIKRLLIILGLFLSFGVYSQQNYSIPEQMFQPYKILGIQENRYALTFANTDLWVKIDSFEISHLVTFKEYRQYLETIQKDSSFSFYLSQLPDSSIALKENYSEYISNKKFDAFPVLGISWDAAMNYCKWKTLQENDLRDLKFIYRLPKLGEWLAAYNYLETNKTTNDFSKNYSDWTMSLYFEGGSFRSDSNFVFDKFIYLQASKDHPRDKRKIVMGGSYLFQHPTLRQHISPYFAFNGYRQIAFRLIKETLKENADSKSLSNRIIIYWGLVTERADQQ